MVNYEVLNLYNLVPPTSSLVIGLYATDKETGEIWWFTGEDYSPTKSPCLLYPDSRTGRYTPTWEERCKDALKQVDEGKQLWWCHSPTLFYATKTVTATISKPLPERKSNVAK